MGLLVLNFFLSEVEDFGIAIIVDFDFGIGELIGFFFDTVPLFIEGPGFEFLFIGSVILLEGVDESFSLIGGSEVG